jgi:putative PEP-CTERM system histidine kinase
MPGAVLVHFLFLAELVTLAVVACYLVSKIYQQRKALLLVWGLVPTTLFLSGSYLFTASAHSLFSAKLIAFGIFLIPLSILPISHRLARSDDVSLHVYWRIYYVVQSMIFLYLAQSLLGGALIEWVTGILDQPVILFYRSSKIWFVNVLGACVLSLLCFDATLRNANSQQKELLKFVFVAFLGISTYFAFVSYSVLVSSTLSQTTLLAGAAVSALSLLFLIYSFLKYPIWEVKIQFSRNFVFGSLSAAATLGYLIVAGSVFDYLSLFDPVSRNILLPAAIFAVVAGLLLIYLSPTIRRKLGSYITNNFFRSKYDYRDLWNKFSDESSGSLNIQAVLPRVTEFISDAMFVRHVAVWLRTSNSDITYALAHYHSPTATKPTVAMTLRRRRELKPSEIVSVFNLTPAGPVGDNPILENEEHIRRLGIERYVFVEKDNEVLAVLGVGGFHGRESRSAEDDRFMRSVGNQLAALIARHKLSEELLLSREWESFNRFASFIIHDLKNLATLQGMTLENAKHLSHNPEFLKDAFATFAQSTDKMIGLISSLSIQRGQFSLKQQPVNISEVIHQTFDDLKIEQRTGVKITTKFPPQDSPPVVAGDPELLQKVFTNLLLNAIQSLPKGQGTVDISVGEADPDKIVAAIRDTGCGIAPEHLQNVFRPFQTTKERGMGIGLCHTRSIVEVHGGRIRIDSEVNSGTTVEVEFPRL